MWRVKVCWLALAAAAAVAELHTQTAAPAAPAPALPLAPESTADSPPGDVVKVAKDRGMKKPPASIMTVGGLVPKDAQMTKEGLTPREQRTPTLARTTEVRVPTEAPVPMAPAETQTDVGGRATTTTPTAKKESLPGKTAGSQPGKHKTETPVESSTKVKQPQWRGTGRAREPGVTHPPTTVQQHDSTTVRQYPGTLPPECERGDLSKFWKENCKLWLTTPATTTTAREPAVPEELPRRRPPPTPKLFDRLPAGKNDTNLSLCIGNIDIKNEPINLAVLRNCKVIEGNLSVVLMGDSFKPENFSGLSFPELVEVTGFVLFYRVNGLRSLGQLFPNLAVIRGTFLIAGYALMVYEMRDLEELGLYSLQRIMRGTVRVESNGRLCFAHTVDWDEIARGSEQAPYLRANGGLTSCADCARICPMGRCWGARRCRVPLRRQYADEAHRLPCHPLCATGCTGTGASDCAHCTGPELQDACVDTCPNNTVVFQERRCIDVDTCRANQDLGDLGGIVFRGKCINECPPGFNRSEKDPHECAACLGPCYTVCDGASIRSLTNARVLKGCTRLRGTLEIEIPQEDNLEEKLEPYLGNIRVITGSLVISRSPSLSSLRFLRSLRVIEGTDINKNKDVFVNENDNLQYLFDWGENKTIALRPGAQVLFFYNPRLCPSEIDKFTKAANLTDGDVMKQFNGFINPCGSRNLSSTVAAIGPESAVLTWRAWDPSTDLIGYAVFVSPAARKDIVEYAGANVCQDDDDEPVHEAKGARGSWTVHDARIVDKNQTEVSQIVPRLRPATLYAYYIKTYTRQGNVNSPIRYFRTHPDRPSPPSSARAAAQRTRPGSPGGTGSLLVAWDPPARPNGKLSHYIVTGELRDEDDRRQAADRDYCEHPAVNVSKALDESVTMDNTRRWFLEDPGGPTTPLSSACCCGDCCHEPLDEDQCERLLRGSRNVVDACGQRVDSMDRCAHLLYTVVSENLKSRACTLFPQKSSSSAPSLNLSEEYHWDGTTKRRFVRVEPATASGSVVGMLVPFGLYSVQVHACGTKEDGDEAASPLTALCSAPAMTAARTLAVPDTDVVADANATLHGDGFNVTWTEPRRPNGMVVAYVVRYRDLHRREANERCITQQSYHQLKGQVRIELRSSLAAAPEHVPGHAVAARGRVVPSRFVVEVRVTTLAGPGVWVNAGVHIPPGGGGGRGSSGAGGEDSDDVEERPKSTVAAVLAVLLLVLALLAVALLVLRRRGKQSEADGRRHLINPDLTDCWDLPGLGLPDDDWPRASSTTAAGAGAAGPVAVAVRFRKNSDTESDRVSFSPLPLLEHLITPPSAASWQRPAAVADVENDDDDDDGLWMRWAVGSEVEQPPPSPIQEVEGVRFTLPPPPRTRKQAELYSESAPASAIAQPQSQAEAEAEADAGGFGGCRLNPTNPFHSRSLDISDCDDSVPSLSMPHVSSTNPFLCDSGVPDTQEQDPRRDILNDFRSLWSCNMGQPSSQEQTISGGRFHEEKGKFEISATNPDQCCSTDSFISVNLSEPEEDTRYLLNKK